MPAIKRIRLCRIFPPKSLLLALCILLPPSAHGASAETCIAPQRPFVPMDARDAQDYADIIRRDFDLYFREIQSYLRCLDEERSRAFAEAREVSEEYGRFVQTAAD